MVHSVSQSFNTSFTYPALLSLNVPCNKINICWVPVCTQSYQDISSMYCTSVWKHKTKVRPPLLCQVSVQRQRDPRMRERREGEGREEMSGGGSVIRQCLYVLNCLPLTASLRMLCLTAVCLTVWQPSGCAAISVMICPITRPPYITVIQLFSSLLCNTDPAALHINKLRNF